MCLLQREDWDTFEKRENQLNIYQINIYHFWGHNPCYDVFSQ